MPEPLIGRRRDGIVRLDLGQAQTVKLREAGMQDPLLGDRRQAQIDRLGVGERQRRLAEQHSTGGDHHFHDCLGVRVVGLLNTRASVPSVLRLPSVFCLQVAGQRRETPRLGLLNSLVGTVKPAADAPGEGEAESTGTAEPQPASSSTATASTRKLPLTLASITATSGAEYRRVPFRAVFRRRFRSQEGCKRVAKGVLKPARNAQNPCKYA